MNKHQHIERTQRIQESGGKLRGGTNGNVWEWGPVSAREDALMEEEEDLFEALMDHYGDIVRYEKQLAELREKVSAFELRDNARALVSPEIDFPQ